MSANLSEEKSRLDIIEEPGPVPSVVPTAPSDPEGERRVRHVIQDAAPKNSALLNDIRNTEEAVSILQGNELRLQHAKDELKDQTKTVDKATTSTKTEFDKYTHRKDSRSTRWVYVLTRMKQNYEKKLSDAQKTYHSALAAQSQAEKRQHELQHDIEAIEKENAGLEKLAAKHVEAHKAIDKLYADIFTGKTPGFPDEDEREQTYNVAKAEHDATSKTVEAMARADKFARTIRVAIERAQGEIRRAEYETDSVLFIADYTQIFVEKAARFVGRAMQLQEDSFEALPKPLDRPMNAAQAKLKTHLTGARRHLTEALRALYPSRDVYFNIIENVSDELKYSLDAQTEMAKLTRSYEATGKESLKITSRVLENARQALHEIRQGAFEITAGFGAAAPPYHECCDRAEWFEGEVVSKLMGKRVTWPRGCRVVFQPARGNRLVFETC
jgi:hypothetical protein